MESQLKTKASAAELTANLNSKANVNDISRTIADLQMHLDKK
jgi:hypothetical protein